MKIGKTRNERREERCRRLAEWNRNRPEIKKVFAWLPVRCDGCYRWLEFVIRRKNYNTSNDFYFNTYHKIL